MKHIVASIAACLLLAHASAWGAQSSFSYEDARLVAKCRRLIVQDLRRSVLRTRSARTRVADEMVRAILRLPRKAMTEALKECTKGYPY